MRELLVLTLLLFTAACSATVQVAPPDPSIPSKEVAPTPSARPESVPAQPPAPTPVPRPAAPKTQLFDLDRLGGATESAVVALIGPPDTIREQSPGKVWVYTHGACHVEVYMYPSVDVGSMGVLGSAILPATLGANERDRCRRNLARRTAKAE